MTYPRDPISGPIVPHRGPTQTPPRLPVDKALPPPPRVSPYPRDGFIVAFGPIDGVTSRRALPASSTPVPAARRVPGELVVDVDGLRHDQLGSLQQPELA